MKEETIEEALARLKASLLPSFDIGGLFSRNDTAHKWKATFRSLLLREAVFWRLEDLLQQSYALHKMQHSLGALILLRSALETLATLIYLNQLTASVLDGSLNFHTFSEKTAVLLLGSRNKSTDYSSINIQTVLQKVPGDMTLLSSSMRIFRRVLIPTTRASSSATANPIETTSSRTSPTTGRICTRKRTSRRCQLSS
jgi:hypothetical protein